MIALAIAAIVAGLVAWLWLDQRRSVHRAVDRELPRLIIPFSGPVRITPAAGQRRVDHRAPSPGADAGAGRVAVQPAVETGRLTTDTVRFRRPSLEAMQLLPGRLEVLAGLPGREDIRFVRAPGEPPHIVLGREPGPSSQHVRIDSPTVSRRHAQLSFSDAGWTIVNLSDTNPIVVNDEELRGDRPLADGDRLELGEVVLRYHAR